jgi:hypothetical protein
VTTALRDVGFYVPGRVARPDGPDPPGGSNVAMFRRTREKPAPIATPRGRPILMCPECGSDKACPMEWAEAGEHHWWLLIRCPDCDAWVQATIGNSLAAALDVELDRQQAQIAAALAELEAEAMAADAYLLAAALELDLVNADDFAR